MVSEFEWLLAPFLVFSHSSPTLLFFGAVVVAFLLDLEQVQVASQHRQTNPTFIRKVCLCFCFCGVWVLAPREGAVRLLGRAENGNRTGFVFSTDAQG